MRIYVQPTAIAALMVLVWTGSAAVQEGTSVQPSLTVMARSLNVDGSSVPSAGSNDPVVVGKSFTQYLYAGEVGHQGLCSVGSSNAVKSGLEALLKTAAHVWKVTTTGVKYAGGRQTVDVDWARYAAASGAVPVASRKQRLTLAQDQTYTLDFVHNTGADCAARSSIIIELTARTREEPALADTVLHYDVWLVRRDASGQEDSRHFMMTGKQGAALPFAFPAVRSDIPKLQANQYDFELLTNVAGQLRGRARQDGRLSIELDVSRQHWLHRLGQDTPPPDGLGGGRKVLNMAWGETVEVQLPMRSGSAASYASPADEVKGRGTSGRMSGAAGFSSPVRQPVVIQNGRLVVNYAEFYAGETMSLILRVRTTEKGGTVPNP